MKTGTLLHVLQRFGAGPVAVLHQHPICNLSFRTSSAIESSKNGYGYDLDYPKVSIIILNWNGWRDTIECLESLSQIEYPNYETVIIDNGSKDDSVGRIENYIDAESRNVCSKGKLNVAPIFIINDKNYGFAEGNNIGIRFSLNELDSEWILLLNNDVVVDPNFLNELVNASTSKSNIGIVGSRILFYYEPKLIQSNGFNINWNTAKTESIGLRKLDEDYPASDVMEVAAVSGCSMLIKRETLLDIGLLDSTYFLYYEDIDICTRAIRAGYKVVCAPKSRLWHKTSQSSKKLSGIEDYYSSRNAFIFMKKYASASQFYKFTIYSLSIKLLVRSYVIIRYLRDRDIFISFLKGTKDGLIESIFKI